MNNFRLQKIIISLLFITISFTVLSQNKKLKRADEAFNSGEYYKAIDLYQAAFEATEDKAEKAEISFQIGECYRTINIPKKAESFYKKAINRKYPDQIAILYYADMLKKNQKYQEALVQYELYLTTNPDDQRGKIGAESCRQTIDWLNKPTRYVIQNIKEINTKQSDFSGAFGRDDYSILYFTSSREGTTGGKTNTVTGQFFTDIFMTELSKKGEWSAPVIVADSINSNFDEGAPNTNGRVNTMLFTRCKVIKNTKIGCKVYETKKSGDNWSIPAPISLGPDSISYKHPSLSSDELTLYFVSEMNGGYGANDIWMVTRTDKKANWGVPVNMGPEINTDGDDVFPFAKPDGTFYYSSNGLMGLGGLDVFKAKKDDSGKWVVENMRNPINSYEDDFGIIFQGNEEKGFFSSTRKGGRGNDDIYSFVLPEMEFNFDGIVKDKRTGEPIEGASVKLVGTDGTALNIPTLKNGSFQFNLKPNTEYIYLIIKEGYLKSKGKLSTVLPDSKDFTEKILLAQVEKPIEIPNILYDFGKWDLREESKLALDELVKTLEDNPNITIELGSHSDMVGDDKINQEVSQKRAQSVVDYLITKGIATDRLTAKGYGKSQPNTITKITANNDYLKEGDILTETFVKKLSVEQQEVCNQINRRTEFKVLTTNYMPTLKKNPNTK